MKLELIQALGLLTSLYLEHSISKSCHCHFFSYQFYNSGLFSQRPWEPSVSFFLSRWLIKAIDYLDLYPAHSMTKPTQMKGRVASDKLHLVEKESVEDTNLPVYVTWAFLLCIILISYNFLCCCCCCLVPKSCPAFWDFMDYSQPGSYVQGVSQGRILEWHCLQIFVFGCPGSMFLRAGFLLLQLAGDSL